jgi:hypothetical protein
MFTRSNVSTFWGFLSSRISNSSCFMSSTTFPVFLSVTMTSTLTKLMPLRMTGRGWS